MSWRERITTLLLLFGGSSSFHVPSRHSPGCGCLRHPYSRKAVLVAPSKSCVSGGQPPNGSNSYSNNDNIKPWQQQQQDKDRIEKKKSSDVHPESWQLGDGSFADAYLKAKEKSGSRPVVGEDPMAVGRALVMSRTEQDRRQEAEDRIARQAKAQKPVNSKPETISESKTDNIESKSSLIGRLEPHLLGVGGMDKVVEIIRRRVWVPLAAPRSLLDDLGVAPVSGLLLHGPPGCGKSLLARRLTSLLTPRPPTFVSGPEILDRFVGSSEANIRALFDFPPPVAAKDLGTGDADDALHVIVLDEFDAIAGKRSAGGGSDGSERVRDSVVNQLLSRMDGVQELKRPTLLVALTNRMDLIDPALLRPGRFEVHIEVALPDEIGRAEILRIHCTRMWVTNRLEIPKWSEGGFTSFINDLASRTVGFSGAELAGVVRAAAAYSLERASMNNFRDAKDAKVTKDDFERGLKDVEPSTAVARAAAEVQLKENMSEASGI